MRNMDSVYEILKLKQEIIVREDFAPMNANSIYSVARWLQEEIGHDAQENLVVLCLDTKRNVVCYSTVHKGSLNQSIAHPRDIFQRAILSNTNCIIISHNHPSNNPRPSETDTKFTSRIKECGDLLGIKLLDHVIVGHNTYFSFREDGYLV